MIRFIFLGSAFLTALGGCATEPKLSATDVVPQPQFADKIDQELHRSVSATQCHVIGCVSLTNEPSHYICTGEFSYVLPGTAGEQFKAAIDKIRNPEARVDFTADEGLGSQLVAALLRGVGGGLAAGATGNGNGFYYVGAGSSSPVKFTASNNSETTGQK